MNWNVAQAKQQLSEVVRAAAEEPQLIYNRERLVAAVLSGEEFQAYSEWRKHRDKRTVEDDFAELRRICEEEDYTLEVPAREDRSNPFAEPDHVSR